MEENKNETRFKIALSALDPYLQVNVKEATEKKINGKDFIAFGDDNDYFDYLYRLYSNAPTLHSIIDGLVDYICGDEIICNIPSFSVTVNKQDETISDVIQKCALDYAIYGGFAIQVIRNMKGDIGEFYHCPFYKLRSDKKNEVFYYSDDWCKSFGRVKYTVYPKFKYEDENPTSILYFKDNITRTTYPLPMWNAAVIPAELEMSINEYHLNSINNGFMGSYIVNMNCGVPDDNIKVEIEKNFNEKFAGKNNAGRILLCYNESKENETTISKVDVDDFANRYESLEKRTKEQLYTAFRATPLLFGLVSESNGFATNEYSDSYKLFNRTVVIPKQKDIVRAFNKLFNTTNAITIKPFTIQFESNEQV